MRIFRKIYIGGQWEGVLLFLLSCFPVSFQVPRRCVKIPSFARSARSCWPIDYLKAPLLTLFSHLFLHHYPTRYYVYLKGNGLVKHHRQKTAAFTYSMVRTWSCIARTVPTQRQKKWQTKCTWRYEYGRNNAAGIMQVLVLVWDVIWDASPPSPSLHVVGKVLV